MSGNNWALWIDESGDGKSRPLVLSGVLANQDSDDLFAAFRADAAERYPWLPWPLHASELNRPGMHLAWALAAEGRFLEQFPSAGELTERTREELRVQPGKKMFEALTAGNKAGRSVSNWFDLAIRLEGALSAPVRKAWSRVAEDVTEGVYELLRALGGELASNSSGCAVFAAHGEAAFENDVTFRLRHAASPADSRYGPWTRAGSELLARAVEVVSSQEAAVTLSPRPLEINGPDPSNMSALLPVHLCGEANPCAGGRSVSMRTEAGRKVKVEAAGKAPFNRNSPAQHVVADLLSNFAFARLSTPTRVHLTLARFEGELLHRAGFRLGFGNGPPALAAAGDLSRVLRTERFQRPAPAKTEQCRWAEEQAEQMRRHGLATWGME